MHVKPLQGVPSGIAVLEQPVTGSQLLLLLWHWSSGAQITAVPPAQMPAWQVSACVQALPSSHAAPSGFAALVQPLMGSQLPPAV